MSTVSPQGLTRVKNATDAVGIVLKELKKQSSLGLFHLLVAVDGVNALWGRTTLKREDKNPVRRRAPWGPWGLVPSCARRLRPQLCACTVCCPAPQVAMLAI